MTRKPASDLSRELHRYIAEYLRLHEESPTFAEIQEALGIPSKSTVAKALELLSTRGIISREARRRRSIRLLIVPTVEEVVSEGKATIALIPPQRQTWLQREVHDYISRYHTLYGYSPTFEEIQKHLRVKSKGSIAFAIKSLEKQGAIRRVSSQQARGIQVMTLPEHWNRPGTELPLLGMIAAGEPIQAITQQDTLLVAQDMFLSKNGYALRVQGDSMTDDGILDGDYLVIESRETAKDGEIVVALIDEENATLKRFFREPDRIRLEPANRQYSPIYVAPPHRLRIQGVLRGVIRKY